MMATRRARTPTNRLRVARRRRRRLRPRLFNARPSLRARAIKEHTTYTHTQLNIESSDDPKRTHATQPLASFDLNRFRRRRLRTRALANASPPERPATMPGKDGGKAKPLKAVRVRLVQG